MTTILAESMGWACSKQDVGNGLGGVGDYQNKWVAWKFI